MATYTFQHVNVFSTDPYRGNPLAVVCDADTLSDTQMQQIARWCHLSETAFLLTPTHADADYRIRIFTSRGHELPFAGHPTLGACHAWLQQGGIAKQKQYMMQECGVGLVKLRQPSGAYWCFAAPPMKHQDLTLEQIKVLCTMLHLEPAQVIAAQLLDNGLQYMVLLLDNAETVLNLFPDLPAIEKAKLNVGVIAPCLEASMEKNAKGGAPSDTPNASDALNAPDFEVRCFTPASGIPEDPITGNLNGALAQWLIGTEKAVTQYMVSQGTVLGRQGRIYISQDATTQQIWVGGDTQTCTQGILSI